ncbi:MAG TPA: DinB family protein [Phycisphaerae bacterium]|nr:DinB family protein [Phycisphaerae bacterium]
MPNSANAEINLLLAMLADAYDGKAWHGPNLRGTLRGVSVSDAIWRPPGAAHSMGEIAVHCAYWKYAARRRLRGDKRGSFPLKGSNWFALGDAVTEAEWKAYLRLLDQEHLALRDAIATLPPRMLTVVPAGSRVTNMKLIYGIAAHDVYHAGQLRLLKAMRGRVGRSAGKPQRPPIGLKV